MAGTVNIKNIHKTMNYWDILNLTENLNDQIGTVNKINESLF